MKFLKSTAVLGLALLANSGLAQYAVPTMPPAMALQSQAVPVAQVQPGALPVQQQAPLAQPIPAPAQYQPPQSQAWPTNPAIVPAPGAMPAHYQTQVPAQYQAQFPAQAQAPQQPPQYQPPALLPPNATASAQPIAAPSAAPAVQYDANFQPAIYQQPTSSQPSAATAALPGYQMPAPQQFPAQQFPVQQVAYQQPTAPVPPMPGYAPAPVVQSPAPGEPSLTQMQLQLSQLQQELAAIRAQQAAAMNPVDAHFDADVEQAEYAEDKAGISKEEKKKPEDPKAMSGKWNNQLEFSSKDKNFKIHVGGRTQLDAVFYEHSPAGFAGAGGVGDQDAVDFRRARLRVDGTMYKYYDFACEYDFANTVNDNVGLQPASDTTGNIINVPAPTDLWIQAREVPILGTLRFGNAKSPIGLEHVASSRFLDFMERSYNQDAFWGAFNNGFSPGIMAFDNYAGENGYWAAGVFKNTSNAFAFDTGDGEYDLTGRLTYLPFYECKGEYMLHVGLSGSHRDTNDNRIRVRSRGSLRNGPGSLNPVFADTGTFFAESQSLINPEVALVWGPWLFQAEYTGSWVEDAIANQGPQINQNLGTVYFQGYYAEALVFLTGEHREYERKEARFGRVIPHQNGHVTQKECGEPWHACPGAWQFGVRYQKLDLTNDGITGGMTQDVTVGLNWFVNPNFKHQWNYVFTHRDSSAPAGSGNINGFGWRVAFDF